MVCDYIFFSYIFKKELVYQNQYLQRRLLIGRHPKKLFHLYYAFSTCLISLALNTTYSITNKYKSSWPGWPVGLSLPSDGSGQKFLTRVGSGQFFVPRVRSGRVRHLWFGFEFWKFPLKNVKFSIFFLRVKKIASGRVRKYPGRSRVGLLFTAGQK